jgi:hypothetical protein
MTDPFANYDNWLASPYSEGVTGQVEDDYGLYEDSFWETHMKAFEAESEAIDIEGVSWKAYAAEVADEMMSYSDFYEAWMDRKEEEARDRYFENRYPDARM